MAKGNQQISVRLTPEICKMLDELVKARQTDRSAIIRYGIKLAWQEWQLEAKEAEPVDGAYYV